MKVIFTFITFAGLARCASIASVAYEQVMEVGNMYTISWDGGDASMSTDVYIKSQLSSIPTLIGIASTGASNYTCTISTVLSPMSGYTFGASQALTSITWGADVEIKSANSGSSPSSTTSPIAQATFTDPLINPSTVPASLTTSGAATFAPTPTSPSISATSTPGSPATPTQKSLTPAVKVGIVIASITGVVLIGAFCFFLGRRLQKRKPNPYGDGIIGAGFVPRKASFDQRGGMQDRKIEGAGSVLGRGSGGDEGVVHGRSEGNGQISELPGSVEKQWKVGDELPAVLRAGRRRTGEFEFGFEGRTGTGRKSDEILPVELP